MDERNIPLEECLSKYEQWLEQGNEGAETFLENQPFSPHIKKRFREIVGLSNLLEIELGNTRVDDGHSNPGDKLTPGGQYQFVDKLGKGGMGTVWLARQKKPIDRLVAVKLIRMDLDFDEVRKRFELEQHSLAKMSHPNIARVYDSGVSRKLGSFFVMEYVDGDSITDYCNKHRLSLNSRLALFLQLCDAINHAHLKGVLHRDIKPSNILVTEIDGVPQVKVIDFGLAKLAGEAAESSEHSDLTNFYFSIGSPAWMSPEQISSPATQSRLIDQRTDVYSLGAVLYQLVTNTTPIQKHFLKEADRAEIYEAIKYQTPTPPSARLTKSGSDAEAWAKECTDSDLHTWCAQLKNDLDWICLKALEKSSGERYRSVADFAEDVRRYMAGEAVHARTPSKIHRLRKYVLRNRSTTLAWAAVAVVLIVGVACTSYFAIRSNNAIRSVEVEKENADEIVNFLAAQIEQLSPDKAGVKFSPAKKQLLLSIQAKIDSLKLPNDSDKNLRLRSTLANSLSGIGEAKLANKEFIKVLDSAKAYFEDEPEQVFGYQLDYGYHLLTNGLREEAKPIFDEILSSGSLVPNSEAAIAAELGHSISEIAPGTLTQTKDNVSNVVKRCVDILGESNRFTIRAYSELSLLHRRLFELPEASKYARIARDLAREHLGEDSLLALTSEIELWEIRSASPNPPGIKDSMEFAEEAINKLGRANPKSITIQHQLVQALIRYKKYDRALEICEDALLVCREDLGPTHGYNAMMGFTKMQTLSRAGRFEEAASYGTEIVPIMHELLDDDSAPMILFQTEYSGALTRSGNFESALEITEKYLPIALKKQGKEGMDCSRLSLVKGKSLVGLLRYEDAVLAFRETLDLLDHVEGNLPFAVGETKIDLGNALLLAGNYQAGVLELEDAELELSKHGRQMLMQRIGAMQRMQSVHLEHSNYQESIDLGLRVVEMGSGRSTRKKVNIEAAHVQIAEAAASIGEIDLSEEHLKLSEDYSQWSGPEDRELAAIHRELIAGFCQMKNGNQAAGINQLSNSLRKLKTDAEDQAEIYVRFEKHLQNVSPGSNTVAGEETVED